MIRRMDLNQLTGLTPAFRVSKIVAAIRASFPVLRQEFFCRYRDHCNGPWMRFNFLQVVASV